MFSNQKGEAVRDINKDVRVASHKAVLNICFNLVAFDYAIEHGMGQSSTPFFHEKNVKVLYSLEDDSRWAKCKHCSSTTKHIIQSFDIERIKKTIIEHVVIDNCIALVDGPQMQRSQMLELLLEFGTPFIVEHDVEALTQEDVETRNKLLSKFNYVGYQYIKENPETALYVKQPIESIEDFIIINDQ